MQAIYNGGWVDVTVMTLSKFEVMFSRDVLAELCRYDVGVSSCSVSFTKRCGSII